MLSKFTILSSAYNKGSFLREWGDSILMQKYRPLEVIIADDVSSDNTRSVIKEIEKKFLKNEIKVKVIYNKKRLYCGSSYKNLMQYATGEYFGVVDADDALTENAVSNIVNLYKKNPNISWIYTQFLWCNERMRERRKGFNRAPGKNESLLDLADRGIHGIGSGWRTFSYKIIKFDKLFPEGLTCAVDKYMAYRLEELGPGLFVDKIFYKHRGHPVNSKNSVSSTKYAMKMWKKVVKKAHYRRKNYKYEPFAIIAS